jgi:hypothetical protein
MSDGRATIPVARTHSPVSCKVRGFHFIRIGAETVALTGYYTQVGVISEWSIAGASPRMLGIPFAEVSTRSGFRVAHKISVYSLVALAKAGLPLLKGHTAARLPCPISAPSAVPNCNVKGLPRPVSNPRCDILRSRPVPRHPRQRHLRRANPHLGDDRHQ